MKKISLKTFLLSLGMGILSLSSCNNEDIKGYENKVFISSDPMSNILLRGTNDTDSKIIKTEIAKQEATDITVSYQVDFSLVEQYNAIYNDKAIALPEANFEIPEHISTIIAGGLKGTDITVLFKKLSTLDREKVYVLPITIEQSNLPILRSAKTSYFVIKGGALINTAADLTKNYLSLVSPGTSTLKDMEQMTIETLIKVNKFGKLISTVLGRESYFLLRIGDAGIPDNQLQLVSIGATFTDPACQIPINQWIHIAVTYDYSTGEINLYYNGVKKGTVTSIKPHTINFAMDDFYIGKSYNNDRWLEGLMTECRIWNRVLTPEEINAKNHFYTVDPQSEGLAAYWKFDEGVGGLVKDHTGNGNDLQAATDLTWTEVSLPKQ